MSKKKKMEASQKQTKGFFLRISKSDSDFLDDFAKIKGTTKTEVIRRAIENFKEGKNVGANSR